MSQVKIRRTVILFPVPSIHDLGSESSAFKFIDVLSIRSVIHAPRIRIVQIEDKPVHTSPKTGQQPVVVAVSNAPPRIQRGELGEEEGIAVCLISINRRTRREASGSRGINWNISIEESKNVAAQGIAGPGVIHCLGRGNVGAGWDRCSARCAGAEKVDL